jgi:hypothetical protein
MREFPVSVCGRMYFRGADRHVRPDFFSDDDTFYPDYDSLVRLLSAYDSNEPVLLGALSESKKQVCFRPADASGSEPDRTLSTGI